MDYSKSPLWTFNKESYNNQIATWMNEKLDLTEYPWCEK